MPGYLLLFVILLLFNLNAVGQKRLESFRNNSNFEWIIDTIGNDIILYYEKNTHAEKHKALLKEKIQYHIKSTMDFIEIERYNKPIHYFILENRQRMKLLAGFETNGLANYKNHFVTAIFSEKINAVYANHELFHLMAANLWGYPEPWINEAMAVYSDNSWYGHNLHELSKYIIDENKYISLHKMSRRLRKYDTLITYPLLGSFAKYSDEVYGRDIIKIIWKTGRKGLKKQIGKTLEDLEQEWLEMLQSVAYKDIKY